MLTAAAFWLYTESGRSACRMLHDVIDGRQPSDALALNFNRSEQLDVAQTSKHVRCFSHRAGPGQNSLLQRHTDSHSPLDRAGDAGSVAIGARIHVLVVRLRRELWQQGGCRSRKRWGSQPIRTVFRSPGQNGLRNVRSGVVDETCLIT